MPQRNLGARKSDEATNDMVDEVVARVLAAMQEQNSQNDSADQAESQRDDAAEQLRQKASGIAETVQQQAASRLDRQKEHAVEELTRVAGTVRQMGDQLKQPEHGAVVQYTAQYGDMAADHLQNLSAYLRAHDVKQLVHEVESFARREPVLFTSGAFLLGLMGARFLKSKPVTEETISTPPVDAAPVYTSPVDDSPPLALPMSDIDSSDELSRTDYISDDAALYGEDTTLIDDDAVVIADDEPLTFDDEAEAAASPS